MAAGGRGGTLAAAARDVPAPADVPAGGVAAAEAAADEVMRRLRPTEASERRRAEVVDYVQRLIGAALGCEAFAYGSVPLKTYLPDGDIDLTVLGNASNGSTLVNDVYCILDSEEQNSDAEFNVKDLDRINAEVRIIKCTIEDIIVDISFNQTGGICALCFLELVDRKVGKNHLFKRSIILIKAWCYYESRLLGAHHGLISTYALEILILYIFNLFHKSLHGPLEVLYRFLEYFSKFDWDNYCISLNGPVALSSLPNLIVEATGVQTDDLLFDNEFLKSSVDKVFEPPRGSGACYTRFRPKHLNIIDPLKEYNNLGRSVNRASFHRIRTAFSYGARKLGQTLVLPSDLIPNEVYGFFKNTLGRNGRGFRPDVASPGVFHPSFGTGMDILEQMSSMSISYGRVDKNRTPHDLSKRLGDNSSYARTNGPTCLSAHLPGGHNIASSMDLRSSSVVHRGTKQYSTFFNENGNGGSEKCVMDCYLDPEMERLTYFSAKTSPSDDRVLMQSQAHVNNTLLTNSYAGVNNLSTDKKRWSTVHVGIQRPPSLSLRLPDLLGDLDLQFKCLRQVQYHLEYLFDCFLQSVQGASSGDKFQIESFRIPTLNILLNADAALPGLLLPSSVKSNGIKLSPVPCSHSTEDISQDSQDEDVWDVACQRNISLSSGTDIPSNGLSPSSSYADSDSSISWCHSSEDSPEVHGTDTNFPRKSYDTYKEQLASSRENGKILTNRPVRIENNQSSVPERSFIPNEKQIALSGRTKEMTIGRSMKVQGYIHSDRKVVETQSWDPQKEFVRQDNNTRQIPIPKYHQDTGLNMKIVEMQSWDPQKEFVRQDNNTRQIPIPKYHQDTGLNMKILWNRQYSTDMEFAQAPTATRQMPKYQPFNSIQSTATGCTSTSLSRNLSSKQIYGTRIEHEIIGCPTRHIPSYEPLHLQNQRRGRVCSKRYSAGKQSYNNHKEHISFETSADHIPCSGAVSTLNGIKREVNSSKFDENENQLWPLFQEMPLSLHSINSQEKPPVSNTSLPSFPITNNPPLETIEFGSLGPFALAFSSKSKKVTNTDPGRRVLTDASTLLVQRSRAGASHSRSPEFCKVGNEDEFPPLNAVVR